MNESLPRLTLTAYVVAFLFVVSPLVDILTNVWPWDGGNPQWRFGLVGVTSNYLISMIFGLLLAALVAAAQGHRATLKVLGVVSVLTAVVLMVLCGSFVLDTLQLRTVVREEQRALFKVGAVKTALKVGASILALLVMAVGTWKASNAGDPNRKVKPAPILMREG